MTRACRWGRHTERHTASKKRHASVMAMSQFACDAVRRSGGGGFSLAEGRQKALELSSRLEAQLPGVGCIARSDLIGQLTQGFAQPVLFAHECQAITALSVQPEQR